jgi:acyl-CoA synthetase (AMP-forming)/AMP-acid ligase II
MTVDSSRPRTLVQLLRLRAVEEPDRLAYTYLSEGDSGPVRLTCGELDRRARGLAARLQRTFEHGDRAVLLYPPGLEYLVGFFGCLYAGLIPVPLSPPRLRGDLSSYHAVFRDARPKLGVTTPALLSAIRSASQGSGECEHLDWRVTDDADTANPDEWRDPGVAGATLAYLQYTSGSTSAPKGVMITHENVLYNLAYIDQGFEHTRDSVAVSWLPHFHDMGLIYGILQPLYNGFPCVLMSPASFVRRPIRWLQAISLYRATHSGGPNFAYEHCVRKLGHQENLSLDLSSWRIAFNGAELVRAETLERFANAFAPYGFRRAAFYPAFGLAEAGLKVCGGAVGFGTAIV